MQHVSVLLFLLFLFLLLHLTLASVDEVPVEVIVASSPCSTTCGLGVKTQTLCLLRDGKAALEQEESNDESEVTERCRVRKVTCQETWQCGLNTMTVTSGERVEIDCLMEITDIVGKFSWRISWRYARGVISSDDSFFARWESPELDRVILDPVREEDAGTYRCDVQDATFHRMKSVYWGIRVLPAGVLNLDYESALARWDSESQQTEEQEEEIGILPMVLMSVSLAGLGAGLVLLLVYWTVTRKERKRKDLEKQVT